MTRHTMKSWPQFFQPLVNGEKKHDLRSTKDRRFAVGDILELHEYDPVKGAYTGRLAEFRVTFITSEDTPCAYSSAALERGYAILSLQKVVAVPSALTKSPYDDQFRKVWTDKDVDRSTTTYASNHVPHE